MELLRKLKIVGRTVSANYEVGWRIYDWFKANPQSLISFKPKEDILRKLKWGFYDVNDRIDMSCRHKYLLIKKSWITYDKYRVSYVDFNPTTGNLEWRIGLDKQEVSYLYDGSNRKSEWEATFIVPLNFLNLIRSDINWKFNNHMEDLYEAHLQAQKEMWIEQVSKTLLEGNYE